MIQIGRKQNTITRVKFKTCLAKGTRIKNLMVFCYPGTKIDKWPDREFMAANSY